MPDYGPEKLRSELVTPLTKVVIRFRRGLTRMEKLINSGKIPKTGLPLKIKMGLRAVPTLKKLYRDMFEMMEAVEDGTLDRMIAKRDYAKRRREALAKKSKGTK